MRLPRQPGHGPNSWPQDKDFQAKMRTREIAQRVLGLTLGHKTKTFRSKCARDRLHKLQGIKHCAHLADLDFRLPHSIRAQGVVRLHRQPLSKCTFNNRSASQRDVTIKHRGAAVENFHESEETPKWASAARPTIL